MARFGLAANGKSGRWYVEIEENLDTGEQTLLLNYGDGFPMTDDEGITLNKDSIQHLSELISALEIAKKQLEI